MLFYLARVDAGASPAAFDSVLGKEGKLQIFSRAPRYSVFPFALHAVRTLTGLWIFCRK
jgi:hypothetical protein